MKIEAINLLIGALGTASVVIVQSNPCAHTHYFQFHTSGQC